MRKLLKIVFATAASAIMLVGASGASYAAPIEGSNVNGGVVLADWHGHHDYGRRDWGRHDYHRYHGWDRHYDHHHHHHHGNAAAIVGGLAAGALIGGAIESSNRDRYYDNGY